MVSIISNFAGSLKIMKDGVNLCSILMFVLEFFVTASATTTAI